MINFFVHGLPIPKARARTVKNKQTGKTHSYTPSKTAAWEGSILAQALQCRPPEPYDEPLGMGIVFHLVKPPSANKRPWPHVKPDLDNLAKSVKDALNGIYYVDDSRVCEMVLRKQYGKVPGVEISIWEIDEPPKELKSG